MMVQRYSEWLEIRREKQGWELGSTILFDDILPVTEALQLGLNS